MSGKKCKNDEICVKVEICLEDMIVVKYTNSDNKTFQGVLLDSTNRASPFGIIPNGGFANRLMLDNPRDYVQEPVIGAADPYPSLSRRHTYFQDGKVEKPPILVPSGKSSKSFLVGERAGGRLGVRLRARQVLCSKCSSVCNEKGENVRETSRKEKENRGAPLPKPSNNLNLKKNLKDPCRVIQPEFKEPPPRFKPTNPIAVESSGKSSKAFKGRRKKGTVAQNSEVETSEPEDGKKKKKISGIASSGAAVTARRFDLVPKVRRLAKSEIEKFSEPGVFKELQCSNRIQGEMRISIPEPEARISDPETLVTSTSELSPGSQVSSSADTVNQPLKIRFSNVGKQRRKSANVAIQYSIIKPKSDDSEDSDQKENLETEIEKREEQEMKEEKEEKGEKEEKEEKGQLKQRKRKGIGSMEDLWDENIFEDSTPPKKIPKKDVDLKVCDPLEKAPVLKISLGKQSTVVMFPPPLPCTSTHTSDSSSSTSSSADKPDRVKLIIPSQFRGRNCTAEAKAAKRALKKAKKEAQRKVMMSPRYLHSWSPSYLPSRSPCHLTSRSPSYLSSWSPSYLAGRSPSYLSGRSPSYLLSRSPSQPRNFSPGQSPAHRGVHASPARVSPFPSPVQSFPAVSAGQTSSLLSPVYPNSCPVTPASPAYTLVCPSSQKIIIRKNKKKKHKKKEKGPNEEKKEEKKEKNENKEENMKNEGLEISVPQSINSSDLNIQDPESGVGTAKQESSEDEIYLDEIAEPILEKPGISMESQELADGLTLRRGDVVWARQGRKPYWPAKIIHLLLLEDRINPELKVQHAQVSWYTSVTTSVLPSANLAPFLDKYENIFHKRRKGAYKTAVKLAADEARGLSPVSSALLVSPTSIQTDSPYQSSPRCESPILVHSPVFVPIHSPVQQQIVHSPLLVHSPAQSPTLAAQ